MISQDHTDLSVRKQSALLEIHRSALYYCLKPKSDDSEIMNEIYDLWTKRPFYGYRRITQELKKRACNINYKRVLRLMREMNIQALYPKKKLSIRNKDHDVYPYLLRDLDITRSNQVWASDITYIKLPQGTVYLVALIDLYSRYIVSWELSNCLSTDFCITMLQPALKGAIPEIVNTDQGTQFTSHAWVDLLKEHGIQISMDGVGRCMDNICIERFWRTLKYEDAALMVYEDMSYAYNKIKRYINFYNYERLHSSLGYKTPAEIYHASLNKNTNGIIIQNNLGREDDVNLLIFR